MRAIALIATVSFLAGCGSDSQEPSSSAPAPASQPKTTPKANQKVAAKKGVRIKVVDSQFGRILADKSGQAVYLFDKEKSGKSECYGACAKAWPPVYAKGDPVAASGAKLRLLGTTKRRDGKLQVTYRGRPVYLYEHDSPGNILCHNVSEFGGLWLVIQPDGEPAPA